MEYSAVIFFFLSRTAEQKKAIEIVKDISPEPPPVTTITTSTTGVKVPCFLGTVSFTVRTSFQQFFHAWLVFHNCALFAGKKNAGGKKVSWAWSSLVGFFPRLLFCVVLL